MVYASGVRHMLTVAFFNGVLIVMTAIGVAACGALFLVDAGYGRYNDRRWGPSVGNRVGWFLLESPVFAQFIAYWALSGRRFEPVPLAFFLLFTLHYGQRVLVYPLLIRGTGRVPWLVIGLALIFNTANAYMQGAWIFWIAPADRYTPAWLTSPQFLIGVCVFLAGFAINLHSDHIMRTLRPAGDTGYHIPRGGMFEYVSAANYFGEFVEWIGWAILTWSWAGAVFAFWTFANLGPRAYRYHRWYQARFGGEYPASRRRMIPFVY